VPAVVLIPQGDRPRDLLVAELPEPGIPGWLRTSWSSSLRDRLSAADSLYAALAQRSAEPLLTTDLRLARAARDAGLETLPLA